MHFFKLHCNFHWDIGNSTRYMQKRAWTSREVLAPKLRSKVRATVHNLPWSPSPHANISIKSEDSLLIYGISGPTTNKSEVLQSNTGWFPLVCKTWQTHHARLCISASEMLDRSTSVLSHRFLDRANKKIVEGMWIKNNPKSGGGITLLHSCEYVQILGFHWMHLCLSC